MRLLRVSAHHLRGARAIAIELGAKYTLTGPDGTVVTFNDPTDANYVGVITAITGLDSPDVRESFDLRTEADGGLHSPFYYGRRPVTIEGALSPDPFATRNVRMDKLIAATNAMRADALLTWVEPTAPVYLGQSVARMLLLRRQQPLRITERRPKKFLIGMVSATPLIYGYPLGTAPPGLAYTGSSATSVACNNYGNAGSPPTITVVTPGASVTLARTGGASLVFTGLSGGGNVILDFAARTITQGGVSKAGAVTSPANWWELAASPTTAGLITNVTVTGAASITVTWRDAWL